MNLPGTRFPVLLLCAGLFALDAFAAEITIPTVLVGDAGNPDDPLSGFGSVDYAYHIGKYEVTNAQYAAFLNAVAATDPHGLYNPNMENTGISRAGTSGSYAYTASEPDQPVRHVSFWDACRFANWLTNGQPTGAQTDGTTEDGMYNLNGVTHPDNASVSRQIDFGAGESGVAVASENEWYKAAYHDPGATGPEDDYWMYSTQSDTVPNATTPNATDPNSANYAIALGRPADIGGYALANSHYGTFDQTGNLAEWTEGFSIGEGGRKIRGGTYLKSASSISASASESNSPTFELAWVGFRISSLNPIPPFEINVVLKMSPDGLVWSPVEPRVHTVDSGTAYLKAEIAADENLQKQNTFPLNINFPTGGGAITVSLLSSVDLESWEQVTPGTQRYGTRRFFRVEARAPLSLEMEPVESGRMELSSGMEWVEDFHIGRYEVTWGEWREVRSWAAANGYDIGSAGAGCADDHPVRSINWYDALKWCNAKSELENLEPVYIVEGDVYRVGEQGYPDPETMEFVETGIVEQNLSADGYRLPLAAEWEYAARGGTQSHSYIYAGGNDLDAVGWYWDNSFGATCDLSAPISWLAEGHGTWPVGNKAANELGIYDVSGNVAEWCWDPVFSNGFRVIAGGGWNDDAFSCEIANTTIGEPYIRFPAIGFRVARSTSLVRVEGGNLPQVSGLGEISVDTFYLGRNEVTWGLWQKVRDWAAANGYDIGHVGSGCDLDHPVTSISWHNAVKWCNARSEMEGLEPVYTVSGAVYRDGQSIPDQDLTASGYRLPTEAEWEFAARGGNLTNGYVYSGGDDIESVGWYLGNTLGISCDMYDGHGTSPVGEKAPNELGINDMSGNVWEWCWNASEVDPDARMFRGGSFRYGESLCTMTYRYYYPPHSTGLSFGFRIARNSAQ